jgi:hypothetical protein
MMERRVELSRELPLTLRSSKYHGWSHLLTCDESWFWLAIEYEQQWFAPSAERPARLRKMINSPKAMIIIFWSPLGFPVIQARQPKVPFTSEFFVDAILLHVAAKSAGSPGHRMVLHMFSNQDHKQGVFRSCSTDNEVS